MSRESYWDYMGRKIRENRTVELSLVDKVKSLEERIDKLEVKLILLKKTN